MTPIRRDYTGNTSYLTNGAGEVVSRYEYKPYGEIFEKIESKKALRQFNKQELDEDTGLHYFNARFYDSAIGRFISADTIVPDPTQSQSYNRYMFVNGNPIMFVDPSGHKTVTVYDGRDMVTKEVDDGQEAASDAATEFNKGKNAEINDHKKVEKKGNPNEVTATDSDGKDTKKGDNKEKGKEKEKKGPYGDGDPRPETKRHSSKKNKDNIGKKILKVAKKRIDDGITLHLDLNLAGHKYVGGGQLSGGVAASYSKEEGFEFGVFGSAGAGPNIGLGGGLTGEIGFSFNKSIMAYNGKSYEAGGTIGQGILVGYNANLPIEKYSSAKMSGKTIHTVGIGIGAEEFFAESHGFANGTKLFKLIDTKK